METREATYIGMIEILSKMYANAMITMLNARRPHMETRVIVDETNAIPMANRPVTPRVRFLQMQPKNQGVCVHIHTETITEPPPAVDDLPSESDSDTKPSPQKDAYATIV